MSERYLKIEGTEDGGEFVVTAGNGWALPDRVGLAMSTPGNSTIADLTPDQARQLATRLLEEADRIETGVVYSTPPVSAVKVCLALKHLWERHTDPTSAALNNMDLEAIDAVMEGGHRIPAVIPSSEAKKG